MHFSKCVDSSDDQRRNNLEISLVERGWVVERGSVARVDSRSRARRVGAWQSRVNGTISSTARAIISSTMRPFRRPERVSWHLRSVLDSILVRQSMFSLLSTFVSKRSSSRTIGPESRKISIIRLANTIAISLFFIYPIWFYEHWNYQGSWTFVAEKRNDFAVYAAFRILFRLADG